MRFSLDAPNQLRTSRGSDENGLSTTARGKIGSLGERESSIARTVERAESDTDELQLYKLGMKTTEG